MAVNGEKTESNYATDNTVINKDNVDDFLK